MSEIEETWAGPVGVRWRVWAGETLLWEVSAPTEQSVVRLARRVGRAVPRTTAGKPREKGAEWMVLGVLNGGVEEIGVADGWFRRVKEVLERDVDDGEDSLDDRDLE